MSVNFWKAVRRAVLRKQAARLLSACACHGEPISITKAMSLLYGVTEETAARMQVARLAVRAWDTAHRQLDRDEARDSIDASSIRDDYALAESLLRTWWWPRGWKP